MMGQGKSSNQPKEIQDVINCTDFSKEEALVWYRSFEMETKNGQMSVEEFKNVYKQLFPNGDSTAFAEHVFRSYDVDKSGYIDFREFMVGVYIMSSGSLDEKLEWAFRLFDSDQDGSVTKHEMLEIITAMYHMVGEPYLSTLLVDGLAARQRMERIFARVDGDGDLIITLEEFKRAAGNDPSVVNLLQFQGGMRFPRRRSSPASVRPRGNTHTPVM